MRAPPGRRGLVAAGACALLLAAFLLLGSLLVTTPLAPYLLPPLALSLPCLPKVTAPSGSGYGAAPGVAELAEAAVTYATSETVPQQSPEEISLSLAVLRRRAPLRLLVFGLGHDSRLWHALNPVGVTVFLEEDPAWYREVRAQSPFLRAHLVAYRTRLDQADRLMATYRRHPACLPSTATGSGGGGGDGSNATGLLRVRGNWACPLALHNLPPEVYETEWDMFMIDAPKGYFAAAPGRMAAIWTAAAMARARRGEGDTDVFLHDVDRRVERMFAEEFLCEKFRVGGTGRLWHFSIPPVSRRGNATATAGDRRPFC
ncbi:probable methyltransferase At1g27930 [Sorghum bicolor]|uniref:probable methyltransferase At1g27930 n=1 Tax=Sorghum bicolor TaxID=4558 RepID=UPI0001A86333|nr:probable methyltransferase At1g27930 [Sorghum bicolor]|eukprot:XP_002449507.1 probable methyltransferase At1g27930 [Sorghum bicolor]